MSSPVNRRRLLAGLTGLAGLGALSACGISGDGNVVVDGTAPQGGRDSLKSLIYPPDRSPTASAEQVVDAYLQAAAGDYWEQGGRDAVVKRLRTYLTAGEAPTWKPDVDGDLTLIRVRSRGNPATGVDGTTLEVVYQTIGVLNSQGTLLTSSDPSLYTLKFNLIEDRRDGWFLHAPPNALYLSDEALEMFYNAPRPIYFKRVDDNELLPDYRYLMVQPEQVRSRLVDLVLNGPARWLDQSVVKIENVQRAGEVTDSSDGTVVVDLTTSPANAEELAQQLARTLRPTSRLQLKVVGQPAAKAVPANEISPPVGRFYAVSDGSLMRLRVPGSRSSDTTLVLGKVNTGVVSGSLSRNEQGVALIRWDGHRQSLWIGVADRVEEAPGLPSQLSQPVWLDGQSNSILLLGAGKIYQVNTDRIVTQVSSRVDGSITSFAVSPEGRRIAIVAGGRVTVAPLIRGGKPDIGQGQVLPSTFGQIRAVAFSNARTLVVAGQSGANVKLASIGIDGTNEDVYGGEFASFAALVADPSGLTLVENGGSISQVGPDKIEPVGLDPSSLPSPSASPTGSGSKKLSAPSVGV